MPGFLHTDQSERSVHGPTPLAPVVPHSCAACIHHGAKCAGQCSRKVCKAHAYRCSKCDGVLCEACWTRHEVRGMHVPASVSEVEAAQRRKSQWPLPSKVHRRTGRYPKPKPTTEAHHG